MKIITQVHIASTPDDTGVEVTFKPFAVDKFGQETELLSYDPHGFDEKYRDRCLEIGEATKDFCAEVRADGCTVSEPALDKIVTTGLSIRDPFVEGYVESLKRIRNVRVVVAA